MAERGKGHERRDSRGSRARLPAAACLITTSLEEARLQDPFPAKGNMQEAAQSALEEFKRIAMRADKTDRSFNAPLPGIALKSLGSAAFFSA
ncbi:hypothetical protein NKY66_09360 [Sinorhizobium meliloti]|jgi:hypothetical protein|uniref:hypothetical protein n=1 Tax=Rhizobium meliloti TaxID=382 RepID=UPI000FD8C1BD|nr:hypothetical protein [Sinorhizobium meliloti]MDW9417693.1 hypothetical protein [Sinorhizobium meliloti]MDW9482948.1 hypothetical protein [Sinorhizobium meliloti]MDW9514105.1 hypothetical protein [Sinorhizobium meliloti]MQW11564.1 hypothetical protein [Sinorhizobium meliloti]RVO63946.1 hypothetical protein CN087_24865 [Sinorhizobium meliloti]